jgi:hypothetical protein
VKAAAICIKPAGIGQNTARRRAPRKPTAPAFPTRKSATLFACPGFPVPEAHRSNAQSPSPGTQDKGPPQTAEPATAVPSTPRSIEPPRNVDTAPSELRSMTDADLKVRYNAVMAEVMRRRRAKQKGQ